MLKKILSSIILITISSHTLADVSKQNRDKYMKSCVQNMSQQYCACQYNNMNPYLSKTVGKDWALKPMKAKDMDAFTIAVEKALKNCT